MAVSLAEDGTHVFNITQAIDGYHQIRTFRTNQALLEDGRFVFNAISTSGGSTGGSVGPVIINIIGATNIEGQGSACRGYAFS
jgi:hypothetical protein